MAVCQKGTMPINGNQGCICRGVRGVRPPCEEWLTPLNDVPNQYWGGVEFNPPTNPLWLLWYYFIISIHQCVNDEDYLWMQIYDISEHICNYVASNRLARWLESRSVAETCAWPVGYMHGRLHKQVVKSLAYCSNWRQYPASGQLTELLDRNCNLTQIKRHTAAYSCSWAAENRGL